MCYSDFMSLDKHLPKYEKDSRHDSGGHGHGNKGVKAKKP